jgi:hypothetical protein
VAYCGEVLGIIRSRHSQNVVSSIIKRLTRRYQLTMAKNRADQPPTCQESLIHGNTMGLAASYIPFEAEKEKLEQPITLEHVQTNTTVEHAKSAAMQNPIEALGIPDWEAKQRKIVKTLDMTLLPQLWILHMFNYLNRKNIA